MGIVHAQIELTNARRDDLLPMSVDALVDTGAVHLCIPQHVANQLDLAVQDRREVTVADGRKQMVDYVGPVRVRFANRQCMVGALVLGDQPLLGAIPMEDMDLVISPARQSIIVNPANPNIPGAMAMGLKAFHS
ncbi:clan AA aspartic protease [Sphingomonas lycopersici]|uniref:Clan AA aspartic protease n=1 Tax=Sphingomonas lycopersici TaxID=2951807 RepID=A0AA42CRV9_9SPHN|nr:clan AA aspartic protease [Sphingomonas lycopersici]MCW6537125.1 clan AA aspartic protease [Sphingomonas lycopersici]